MTVPSRAARGATALAAIASLLAIAPAASAAPLTPGPGAPSPAVPPAGAPRCSGFAAPEPVTHAYREAADTPVARRSLDVYAPARDPACPPAPVVLHFHGGGYVIGDKALEAGDKAALFAREGWVFISANYRLSPRPPTRLDPARVRYPAAQQDAAAAIAWVHDNARLLRVDASRLMLSGHSAGAHLVALVSNDARFLRERGLGREAVRCTVVLDTEALDLPRLVASGQDDWHFYRNAIGTEAEALQAGSPLQHVAPGVPAQLVVTRGGASRQDQARAYVQALQAVESPGPAPRSRLLAVNGYSHRDVNVRLGEPGEARLTPAVMDFLRGCAR